MAVQAVVEIMIKINGLHLEQKIPEISKLDLCIEEGEVYVLLTPVGDRTPDHLINIFLGLEKRFTGQVHVDGMDIISRWRECRDRLVCFTGHRQWPPDMRIGDVVFFFKKYMGLPEETFEEFYIKLDLENKGRKKMSDLDEGERRNILFALYRQLDINNYVVRDFAEGMPLDFNLEFKKIIRRLKRRGCSILYLGSDVFFAPEIGDRIGFVKKGRLLLELKAAKMKKMNLKELYFQFLVGD